MVKKLSVSFLIFSCSAKVEVAVNNIEKRGMILESNDGLVKV